MSENYWKMVKTVTIFNLEAIVLSSLVFRSVNLPLKFYSRFLVK